MKLVTWNVNGLRACLQKGFAETFAALDADLFSVQETKMQPGQADFAPEGYEEYLYSAEKKGYSGTGCWCRQKPLNVQYGLGLEEHDHEGRVITLEYPEFWLVTVYTPNSQAELARRLGVSRASLYRALDALAGRGVLRREGRRVQVLQPDALEQN